MKFFLIDLKMQREQKNNRKILANLYLIDERDFDC